MPIPRVGNCMPRKNGSSSSSSSCKSVLFLRWSRNYVAILDCLKKGESQEKLASEYNMYKIYSFHISDNFSYPTVPRSHWWRITEVPLYSTWASSCITHGFYAGSLMDITGTSSKMTVTFHNVGSFGGCPNNSWTLIETCQLNSLKLVSWTHWNLMSPLIYRLHWKKGFTTQLELKLCSSHL